MKDVIGYVVLTRRPTPTVEDPAAWEWAMSTTDANTFDTLEEAEAELRMRSLEDLFIAALLDVEATNG